MPLPSSSSSSSSSSSPPLQYLPPAAQFPDVAQLRQRSDCGQRARRSCRRCAISLAASGRGGRFANCCPPATLEFTPPPSFPSFPPAVVVLVILRDRIQQVLEGSPGSRSTSLDPWGGGAAHISCTLRAKLFSCSLRARRVCRKSTRVLGRVP